MKKNTRFLIQKPIAHRGLWSKKVAENSLLAFSYAIDADYPIELDVQITSDGKLVVFHDWALDRMTNKKGKLAEKKYDEIKNITLDQSNQTIPLFEDVLNLVNSKVALIIEIKSRSYFNYKICERAYALLEKYNGEYAISSFNPFVVRWFAKNASEVVRGQNFTDFRCRGVVRKCLCGLFAYSAWIVGNNPDFLAVQANTMPNSRVVKIAKKCKKPLLVWEIKDDTDYNRIKNAIDNKFF